jgi:hypothetical protein
VVGINDGDDLGFEEIAFIPWVLRVVLSHSADLNNHSGDAEISRLRRQRTASSIYLIASRYDL